jgi:hypothetical protein
VVNWVATTVVAMDSEEEEMGSAEEARDLVVVEKDSEVVVMDLEVAEKEAI